MITLPVGEFKSQFSDVLKKVGNGEEFVISFGKQKQKVAAIIPYEKFKKRQKARKIGLLKGRARYKIQKDFKMSETEFLAS
jgi:antitoxin (DNA-binding transcriptional repressor) of toxin-antitoxin stability system